ncbi:MAG TPA: hypothetical protein VE243_07565 [Candidatus Acidoferrum sp.]|nr:hypothetical protein [Candidatus Acidoferrum sp.]
MMIHSGNGPLGKSEPKSLEDFLRTWGAATITGIVASILTGPAVRWLVPWNREQLIRPFALITICVGLYLECVMLLAKSTNNNDSARKLFLIKSLAVYFGARAGGEIAQILWTLKWGG